MSAALILAGTRPGGDPLAQSQGVAHKALIDLDGTTLLNRVVSALKDAGIDRIAVSCDDEEVVLLARRLGVEIVPPGPGPSASVAVGFEILGAPLVVTTSDHGFLRGEWIRELIDGTPEKADISIMLAERQTIERALPGSKRTYLGFADGRWSGCNLFYLQTPRARRAIETWSMVEADRKRPWRIAARLGFSTLFSMLVGRLTLADGLDRLGRKVGVSACLVEAADGLAAVDIDRQSDLDLARTLIEEKRSHPSAL